jgi:hypothetical protein
MKGKANHAPPPESFGFDLEEILKDKEKARKIDERMDSHAMKIKDAQRQGHVKEDFSKLSTIIEGLMSFKKVLNQCQLRALAKSKKRK